MQTMIGFGSELTDQRNWRIILRATAVQAFPSLRLHLVATMSESV